MNDLEKHKYLMEWFWECEKHPELNFDVYSHNRFPGMTFKLNAAYEKMKLNEPSTEPILTARYDDPEAMDKVKDFLHMVTGQGKYRPKTREEQIEDLMSQIRKKS